MVFIFHLQIEELVNRCKDNIVELGDLWMSYVKEILALLREKEYKLTPQRKIIIQAFFDNMEKHLSAEDVLILLAKITLRLV